MHPFTHMFFLIPSSIVVGLPRIVLVVYIYNIRLLPIVQPLVLLYLKSNLGMVDVVEFFWVTMPWMILICKLVSISRVIGCFEMVDGVEYMLSYNGMDAILCVLFSNFICMYVSLKIDMKTRIVMKIQV